MQTNELGYDPKNMQSVFDFVVKHLYKQGVRAVYKHGCAYRVEGTSLRCSIGALIPDSLYDERIEGSTVSGIKTTKATHKYKKLSAILQKLGFDIKRKNCGLSMLNFLSRLQTIHDTLSSWCDKSKGLSPDGEASLKRLAREFNLDTSVLDKLSKGVQS
jgi:hypothetical protein